MARAKKADKPEKAAKKSKAEAVEKKSKKAKPEKTSKKSKKVKDEEEEPTKAKKSKKADAAEPSTKKSKKTKAEKPEKVKKGKRAKAEDDEDEAPAKSKKSKKAKAEKPEKVKKGKVAVAEEVDEDEEDEARSRKGKKSRAELLDHAGFNPYDDIDSALDKVEKDLALGGSALNLSEQRMSTGLLGLDLVVGKGMVPGWYTVFGPEQSCKSTGAMAIMSSALLSNVPIKAYFDYEGCVVGGSKIVVENKETTIHAIISDELEATRAEGGLNVEDRKLHITSAGVRQNVLSITSKGVKPIHRLVTESGKTVEGYAHPILCVNSEGLLEWKLQEEIAVGDRVVTKAGQPVSYE